MKEIYKSALWALISIPITMIGLAISYALAHGAWPFLLIFYAPGLFAMWLIGNSDLPEWAGLTIAFASQYIGYLLFIHGFKKLKNVYKSRTSTA